MTTTTIKSYEFTEEGLKHYDTQTMMFENLGEAGNYVRGMMRLAHRLLDNDETFKWIPAYKDGETFIDGFETRLIRVEFHTTNA